MPSNHAPDTDEEFVGQLRTAYQSLEVTPAGIGTVRAAVAARKRRRRLTVGGGALLAAAAAAVVAGIAQPWAGPAGGPDPSDNVAAPVVVRSGATLSEAWPSQTSADWAGWADAVVLVEVTAESAAGQFPADDGSGEVVIGRKVELKIADVLWSRGPGLAAGDVVELSAAGWLDRPGKARARVAFDGVPRMEVDNSYVVALRNQDGCGAEPAESAEWAALGSSAVWPVEGSTIGTGESEGRRVAGGADQADPGSLEADMVGRTVADLRRELASTRAAERQGCRQ